MRLFARRLLPLLALLLLAAPRVGLADEEERREDEARESAAEEITDARARELAALLSKAAKKRDAEEALAALEEVQGISHPELHKPLLKLLSHDVGEVALQAADLLAEQRLPDAKAAEKLAKAIWKSGWSHRANDNRWIVQARALKAMATVHAEELSDRDFREVEKLWRAIVGRADKEQAPALVDICAYVQAVKDKRLCRMLAEEIDEPHAANPSSPTNPPASWWEGRWHLWNHAKGAVHEALKVLTGQTFKSTEEAKAWFEANEREFGFKW